MSVPLTDPVAVAQVLIRQPTVNPCDDQAIVFLDGALRSLGFRTKRYKFENVDNLYARFGEAQPNFCYAGHTDVVPPGDLSHWSVDPFAAEIRNGVLIGRGAVDMKSSIAAFLAAAARFLETGAPEGSISFLITGDEEGPSLHGTRRFLPAVVADGERLDHCLVGEPTSEDRLADIVKNGRRGSLNGVLRAVGKQGHAAYPEKSANPVPKLLDALQALRSLMPLDEGSPGFQPSNLEITTVDVGNPAHNVIPAAATAKFNIRFNPRHTGDALMARIRDLVERDEEGVSVRAEMRVSGEAFYTDPGPFTDLVLDAVAAETGVRPRLATNGGTSDARFIKDVCPVAELGLANETAHKVDEQVRVEDVETLCRIYHRILDRYFTRS